MQLHTIKFPDTIFGFETLCLDNGVAPKMTPVSIYLIKSRDYSTYGNETLPESSIVW